jgi:DNA-binding NarL/FixJ family response regulator
VNKPRILLADDHLHVLANLSRLADEAGEVVGAVQDGLAAVAESLRLRPDVIVVDLAMPVVGGLDAARRIRRDVPGTSVIICTVHTDPIVIDDAFAAGAAGFIRKQSTYRDLETAIRAVLAGQRFVSPELCDERPRS